MNEEITPEEIQQHYNAAMDSVNLINAGKPTNMSDSDWSDMLERNKQHLKIMLSKTYWTNQNLEPLRQASL